MQYDPNLYANLQESQDQQKNKYPTIPSMPVQQGQFPGYYMPIQPNSNAFYPVMMPQFQGAQMGVPQPMHNMQMIPQAPMYFYGAPMPMQPVDNTPSLIELIRSSTPEHFYKCMLRFFMAMVFVGLFSMIWLTGHGYARRFMFKMGLFNAIFNVVVILPGLKAISTKSLKKFRCHNKLVIAFLAVNIYKLLTGLFFWGFGMFTLLSLLYVAQGVFMYRKGRKLMKQFKKEWKKPVNENQQPNVELAQNTA